jgi:hypothetical protein
MTVYRLDTKQYNYNSQYLKPRYTTEQQPPHIIKR